MVNKLDKDEIYFLLEKRNQILKNKNKDDQYQSLVEIYTRIGEIKRLNGYDKQIVSFEKWMKL